MVPKLSRHTYICMCQGHCIVGERSTSTNGPIKPPQKKTLICGTPMSQGTVIENCCSWASKKFINHYSNLLQKFPKCKRRTFRWSANRGETKSIDETKPVARKGIRFFFPPKTDFQISKNFLWVFSHPMRIYNYIIKTISYSGQGRTWCSSTIYISFTWYIYTSLFFNTSKEVLMVTLSVPKAY